MDLRENPGDAAFREEARTWLEEHCPPEWRNLDIAEGSDQHLEVRRSWEKKLAAANWIGISWPEKYGGRGGTLSHYLIFAEEHARVGAPSRLSFFGEGLLGPTILAVGEDWQRERFLPEITSSSVWWCQGFSEPDAGSDLAGCRTRAERDGDQWVITGQKIWTSLAEHADHMFLLARTDPAAASHRGLSYLLVPMRQPAITVRPIRQLTGSSEFSEVFLDGAQAPLAWVVGGLHQGWKTAMTTLGYERSIAVTNNLIRFRSEYASLVEFLRAEERLTDRRVRDRLMQLYSGLRVMGIGNLRLLSELAAGGKPGPASSRAKLFWSEWHRDFTEAVVDLLGAYGMLSDDRLAPGGGGWQRLFLQSRSETIYAGTSEIQRNVIAEQLLGLPKEPLPTQVEARQATPAAIERSAK